jgi:hypothetical protein
MNIHLLINQIKYESVRTVGTRRGAGGLAMPPPPSSVAWLRLARGPQPETSAHDGCAQSHGRYEVRRGAEPRPHQPPSARGGNSPRHPLLRPLLVHLFHLSCSPDQARGALPDLFTLSHIPISPIGEFYLLVSALANVLLILFIYFIIY